VNRPQPAYVPADGDTVLDVRTQKVGRVMGHEGPRYQLRPVNGGKEWEAEPDHIRPASRTDVPTTAVAGQNAQSPAGWR
jgi:hypothetical protein